MSVLSASRIRDMVRFSPDLLAGILLGQTPCSLGRYRPSNSTIDPARVKVVVLWTKDPGHVVDHPVLRAALDTLIRQYGCHVVCQLTCTGLAGTPVEFGVPNPVQVAASLARCFDAGLLDPRTTTWRYDPVGTFHLHPPADKDSASQPQERPPHPSAVPPESPRHHQVVTNGNVEVFGRLLDLLEPLGIRDVVTSSLQTAPYPAVERRCAALGVTALPLPQAEMAGFLAQADALCSSRGVGFSVCVTPGPSLLTLRRGCIDVPHWSKALDPDAKLPMADSRPHGWVGSQRKGCLCTYSADLGYTRGVRRCQGAGSLCLYCYASSGAVGAPLKQRIRSMIEAHLDPTRTDINSQPHL